MLSGSRGADLSPMTPIPGRTDRIRSSWRREEAQTMAEYAVMLAVITPVVVLAFATFGNAIIPTIDAVRSFL
jgi:Flp pilus assembly pilin Flp